MYLEGQTEWRFRLREPGEPAGLISIKAKARTFLSLGLSVVKSIQRKSLSEHLPSVLRAKFQVDAREDPRRSSVG